jgi:carboxylesterase type B
MPFPDGWKNSSFTPTVDGKVLVDDPAVLARQGHAAQVPVLLGCDKNEGVAFVTHCPTCSAYLKETMSENQYVKWVQRNFAQPWVDKLLKRYSTDEFTPFFAAAQATGDLVVRCPTHRAARFLQKPSGASIFLYRYTHEPLSRKLHSGNLCAAGAQGAFHGSEIPFFFHVPEFLQTRHEEELGRTMVHYLRNFAWSGDPNIFPPHSHDVKVDLPVWPPFLNVTEAAMNLGTLPDGKLMITYGQLSAECWLMDAYVDAGQPVPTQACGEQVGCAPMPHDEEGVLGLSTQMFRQSHVPSGANSISLI